MQASRIKRSFTNILVNYGSYFLTVILNFAVRTIFIYYLGIEYLGINGLFSSVLLIFSLSELGFGTAIIFSLYKTIAKGDEHRTAQIINYFAKIYRVIGITILCLGATMLPFVHFLIKDFSSVNIPLNQLRVHFALFVLQSGTSYFFAYKSSIFNADQKRYIVLTINFFINLIIKTIQILILVISRNFLAYLSTAVVFGLLGNFILWLYANHKYPYLKKYKHEKISKEDRNTILKHVYSISLSRVGSVICAGAYGLMISILVGLREVGIYSNYTLITATLTTFISLFFDSIMASLGNFGATKSKTELYEIFKAVNLINAMLASTVFVGIFLLVDEFMIIWTNSELLLPKLATICISINIFFGTMRNTLTTFISSLGLFSHHKYRAIVEVILAVGGAYLLGQWLGISGILLAQIIAGLAGQIWIEIYIVCQHGLKTSQIDYYKYYLFYIAITLLSAAVCWGVLWFITSSIVFFIIKVIICVVITVGLHVIMNYKTQTFRYILNTVKVLMRKRPSIGQNDGEKIELA